MAGCQLDYRDPRFLKSIGGQLTPALEQGLEELANKVLKGHKLSGWFNHPMAPHSTETVWKWDFQPDGYSSYTRKGWRICAHVANPDGPEPVQAVVFLAEPRGEVPKGNAAKRLAQLLKQFLAANASEIKVEEESFKRQTDPDGRIRSICYACYESILSLDSAEADVLESVHECPAPIPEESN